MSIRRIRLEGLRGFVDSDWLALGVPTGKEGSGLTVITGPNNSGKSTIIEALHVLTNPRPPSFAEEKRNSSTDYRVTLTFEDSSGISKQLASIPTSGSETTWTNGALPLRPDSVFVLPSRRYFSPYFGKHAQSRQDYISVNAGSPLRNASLGSFGHRLFTIQQNREAYDSIMSRILTPVPEWYIEMFGHGQYYLKFKTGASYHSSEGLGEGIVSLFIIVDALYDSQPDDLIVIDEPELSLHPSLQRRLLRLLASYAIDRQIVYATHSPYLIDFVYLAAGAELIRMGKEEGRTNAFHVTARTRDGFEKLLDNANNPHLLGLDAKEILFIEDNVILVEGQEDVIFYQHILNQLGVSLNGTFYGWGVGGAGNMSFFCDLLRDLGFGKVVCILDRNQVSIANQLKMDFPQFKFIVIPANDVRSKPERPLRRKVVGLLDEEYKLREEFRENVRAFLEEANDYLNSHEV